MPAAHAADPVAYPAGYREWRHVKSMVLEKTHPLADPFAGIHHIYANPKAVEGLASGRYADGAVFVFDLFEAKAADAAVTEGPRKLVSVMVRNGAAYKDVGGWAWEAFAGDSRDKRLVSDGGKGCFACHASEAKTDYVFTRPRD